MAEEQVRMLAAADAGDPELPMPSAGGQRKRMLPIYSAVCLSCCLLASFALAGLRARSRPKFGGHVGLEATGDADDIWAAVSGSSMIEQLQEQIDAASGDAKAALEEKQTKLKEDIPDWEEITSAYSGTDAWDDIKDSAKVEALQEAVAEAQASGSDKLDDLQEELKRAMEAVPSINDTKEKAAAVWQEKAEQLPDLDDVRAHAQQLADDMQDSVSGMLDSAWGSMKKWW
ncbi:unnamed protein product [Prorocentrum cordatum]|uniref:Uncharacterized protein n=1 Tax=Prorocentrum cordatum TaxID=2364126 RepID=A0ABN9V1T6_9DINO|nr:unnamed protein product [Polarella glacialis]